MPSSGDRLGVRPLWHEVVGCDTMAVAQLRYREGARWPVSVALL